MLAISLGDPAGVGPELTCEAWARRKEAGLPVFVAAGGHSLLREAGKSRGLDIPVTRVANMAEAAAVFEEALPVLGDLDGPYRPGAPDGDGARLALESLRQAASIVQRGEAAALVTGPIAKARLAEVGFDFPGQTEFVAHACGAAERDAVMLLAGPRLKTVPLTVHVALAKVPGLLTIDLICHRTRIVAEGMRRDFGIPVPRIAIAALNPHAGEDGRMGDEEQKIISPAVEILRSEGIDASGPHPADTLFAPHARGTYDVAIAMYHDQALVPLKALDFDEGVNMTLGLPVVRTSPDHGTAFDIAGTNKANPGAMIAAIRLAGEAAARRGR